MPLPENSAQGNLHLLQNFLTHHTDQQSLHQQWVGGSGNNHQLAICFTFPEGFTINLKQVKQDTSYGERVMRLCESVNQPDTIKADLWTRSTNNGTLSGIRPGIPVEGEPIPPEEFLGKLNYTLVSFVYPGPKHGGGKYKLDGLAKFLEPQGQSVVATLKSSSDFTPSSPKTFLGVPIATNPLIPPGKAFLMGKKELEALTKMGDAIDKANTKKPKNIHKKPTLKDLTIEQSDYDELVYNEGEDD